jgi:hypothetical protein
MSRYSFNPEPAATLRPGEDRRRRWSGLNDNVLTVAIQPMRARDASLVARALAS